MFGSLSFVSTLTYSSTMNSPTHSHNHAHSPSRPTRPCDTWQNFPTKHMHEQLHEHKKPRVSVPQPVTPVAIPPASPKAHSFASQVTATSQQGSTLGYVPLTDGSLWRRFQHTVAYDPFNQAAAVNRYDDWKHRVRKRRALKARWMLARMGGAVGMKEWEEKVGKRLDEFDEHDDNKQLWE